MSGPYRITRLANGVRIATASMPQMKTVAVGLWAGVGGRHEPLRQNGIAHFIEHLLFKGTAKRTARQITEDVEGIGGYINAFTTEDHTCFYTKAAAHHLRRLCEVVADLYVDSTFPAHEIERERDVIREEILMYRDQPSQHAQELLSDSLWPRHPLGRPLTGKLETIERLKRRELMDFQRAHYCGRATVAAVAGACEHEEVVAIFKPLLERLPAGKTPRFRRAPSKFDPVRLNLHAHDTEQTHLALGFHAFGRRDERRYALKLLSVILGENMSSRLFQKLREHHGYCYSINSTTVTLADAGAISIYAGLDHGKLERSIKMILREVENICRRPPGRGELRKAKDYTVGQMLMGLESTSNQMIWMGESVLGYGAVHDPAMIEAHIAAVQPEDVQRCACHCLHRGRLGAAIVGPAREKERVAGWLA